MGKSGQTRILAIGEVGDKTGGDRPREHCICLVSRLCLGNVMKNNIFKYKFLLYINSKKSLKIPNS